MNRGYVIYLLTSSFNGYKCYLRIRYFFNLLCLYHLFIYNLVYNDTVDECKYNSKQFSTGKVIANLNFGFWTNLCVKKYNSKIWNKKRCFYGVFPNYNGKMSINIIAKKLYNIRRLRNRIFHYEKIFKYPQRTLGLYNDILEILSYLPSDNLEILKQTTTFIKTYNELTQK